MNLFECKAQARLDMKETRPRVWWTALIYVCFVLVFTILLSTLSGYSAYAENLSSLLSRVSTLNLQTQEELMEILAENADTLVPEVSTFSSVMCLVIMIVYMLIQAGFSGYCLMVSKKQPTSPKDLMICFEHPLRLFFLLLLKYLLISVLLLFLVVPGIIAALCYSQAVFIHYEHPDYGPLRCLRESRLMMKGRKGHLFALVMTFALLWFLNQLLVSYTGIPIIQLYLAPFYGLTMAHFYSKAAAGESFGSASPDNSQGPNEPPQNRAL